MYIHRSATAATQRLEPATQNAAGTEEPTQRGGGFTLLPGSGLDSPTRRALPSTFDLMKASG